MEVKQLQFNAWAGFYLLIALIYLYLAYTEVTGSRFIFPAQVVEAEPVIELPEAEEDAKEEEGESDG